MGSGDLVRWAVASLNFTVSDFPYLQRGAKKAREKILI
jgi:hypothetical protein